MAPIIFSPSLGIGLLLCAGLAGFCVVATGTIMSELPVHAQPRSTKDLELFVQPDTDNARAIFAALAQFGAPLEGLKPDDLIEQGSFFRMGSAPQMIEIFSEISGVAFDEAWGRRVERVVDEPANLRAFFISAEDFVANKLAAARLQDIADAAAVRPAGELRSRDH